MCFCWFLNGEIPIAISSPGLFGQMGQMVRTHQVGTNAESSRRVVIWFERCVKR